jgi:long-chain acyl-CoA synthetase
MLLHNLLKNSANEFPDNIAVQDLKSSLTYRQIEDYSSAFCFFLLEKGIKKGDRVIIFLDNCCSYLSVYFGVSKSGAVIVAVNSQLVARELAELLSDCTPKVIITDTKHQKVVSEAAEISQQQICVFLIEDFNHQLSAISHELNAYSLKPVSCNSSDLAQIIYTSGTTGKPKGVILSHKNVTANAESIVSYLNLTSNDKIMAVLPFYYSYGNSLLTTHIKVGGSLIIDNRFMYPNVVLENMFKSGVTGFAGVPSHFAILLRKSAIKQYKFSTLRYVTQAGGAMPPSMIKEFLNLFPDVKFYVMYGQTEASARLSYLDPADLENKISSIGKAIPGVILEVLKDENNAVSPGQVGEITAQGENIMSGYWNDPDQTKQVLKNGKLFTGDLAKVDEEGFLYIVSRKKDMIKSGANRISPHEIENVVCQIQGVIECAAVGIPDEIFGEAIALYVVKDETGLDEKQIMLFCKKNLAVYKLPKHVKFVDSLPKTASGKVKREILKDMINKV